jgi:hypothetical protein
MRRRIRGMMMSGKQFSLDSRMDLVQSNLARGEPSSSLPLMREASLESDCGPSHFASTSADQGKLIISYLEHLKQIM